MIGAYIVTRCIDIGTRPNAHAGVKVFSALTLLFTVVCMVSPFLAGGDTRSTLP